MDCSTPGSPVRPCFPGFAQTHVHWVSDGIQPSHPLLLPSPPALSLSQHQNLFQWVSSSHQWPKYWSFSFIISLSNEYSGLISLQSRRLSRALSSTLVQKHLLFCTQVNPSPHDLRKWLQTLLCFPLIWMQYPFSSCELLCVTVSEFLIKLYVWTSLFFNKSIIFHIDGLKKCKETG